MPTMCQVLCRADNRVVARQDPALQEPMAFAFYLLPPLPYSHLTSSGFVALQSLPINGKLG